MVPQVSHTVISNAAGVAQADLAVSFDCVDLLADALVVIGGTGRVLGDGIRDTLRRARRGEVVDAKGGGHGGKGRKREDSDRCHCDQSRFFR